MADSPDFIPDSQFKPDANTQAARSPDFVPDSQFQSDEDKYDSAGQRLLTGIEGAASAGTFGLSTGLEKYIGRALNIESLKAPAIEARREINPGIHGLGQVVGLVGSSFLVPGGGAAGLLEHAGQGAAELAGLGAAEGTAAKIGSAAVRGAVDNMLFQSGDEVSKMFSGHYENSNDAVQSAAANVGLSGLIGGGLGAGIGVISPLWKATIGKKLNGILGDLSNQVTHSVENGTTSVLPDDYLAKGLTGGERAATSLPENYFDIKRWEAMANQAAPNAAEREAALKRLGIEPAPWMLTDNDFIKRMADHLRQRPGTVGGEKTAQQFADMYQAAEKKGLMALRDSTLKTEAEAGKEIKSGILDKFESQSNDLNKRYDAEKVHFQNMEVTPELKAQAITNIESHPWAKDPEYSGITKRWSDRINAVDTVDKLKETTTLLNKQIEKARREGGPELDLLYAIKDQMRGLRSSAIEHASSISGLGSKEAGAISSETIQRIKGLDKDYAAFKGQLKDFARESGTKNVGSTKQLLDVMGKYSDEDFAKRLFDVNDVNQLKYFEENHPKEFELARRYKLKEIYEKSLDESQGGGGKFSLGKFLGQLTDDKINPEPRNILFKGHGETIADLRTLFRNIPKNYNPSGTAPALGLVDILKHPLANFEDGVKYAIINRVPQIMKAVGTTDAKATGIAAMAFVKSGQPLEGEAFKSAVHFISDTIKGENLTGKAVKGVFKAGSEVIPSKLIPDDRSREKLDKKLKELQTNQTPLFDVGGKTAHYLPEHGSAIAQTSMNAVNFLNSIRPVPQKQSPLDSEPEVTKAQKNAFHQALDIAEQPLIVLDNIKKGTISPSDIHALNTIYPAFYTRLKSKVYNEMIEHVNNKEPISYATRMGVSMFLGEPLDSTLKPESIVAAQSAMNRGAQQEEQKQAQQQQSGGAHSMKSLAKLPSQYATPSQAREAQKIAKA